jgi:hypothetical protein
VVVVGVVVVGGVVAGGAVTGGAVAGGAVAGGSVTGGAVAPVGTAAGVMSAGDVVAFFMVAGDVVGGVVAGGALAGDALATGTLAAGAVVVAVGWAWVGGGETAPEDEQAARSSPPATRIGNDRTTRCIRGLLLLTGDAPRVGDVPLRPDYRRGVRFVHRVDDVPRGMSRCGRCTTTRTGRRV